MRQVSGADCDSSGWHRLSVERLVQEFLLSLRTV
jgi:hypothetical protein